MNNNGLIKILEKLGLNTSDEIRAGKLDSIGVNDLTKRSFLHILFLKCLMFIF